MNLIARGTRQECGILKMFLSLFGVEACTRNGCLIASGRVLTASSELLRAAEEAERNERRIVSWYIRREAAK